MSLSSITLASGRSVDLTELRMASTYGGFLEGYPCRRINDMKTRSLLLRAEQAFPQVPVHPVPPALDYPDMEGGAFGPVEVLPPVMCTGLFSSAPVSPAHDPVLYRSALVVVWFQHIPSVPAGDDADPALRDIRWAELARDDEL
ncbi:hypothetical protein ACIQ9E_15895 [Streptomyces sp. NPDC094448]|uniref:hypothetical protein n=1 Tax=Streptomyces sp. NPDC094448 TaxID=3366063 RepID=UPI0037F2194D